MVLALFEIPRKLGYAALALFVGIEASGVPVPGETALITSAVLASQGRLEIWLVIASAAVAAVVGDNLGYLLGRRVGRRFILRPGRTRERRLSLLAQGERLFHLHGPKAVFFGRWIAGLRIWAAWLAGITSMPWRSFLLWNALGGLAWAMFFGLLGYWGGDAVAKLISSIGIGAAVMVLLLSAALYALLKRKGAERAILDRVLGDDAALVRACWAAVSDWAARAGDIEGFEPIGDRYLAPDVVFEEDPTWPGARTLAGREAVARRFREYAASPEFDGVEPGEVRAEQDGAIIAALRLRVHASREYVSSYAIDVANGKVTGIRATR